MKFVNGNRKRHICLLISSLNPGGAERVLVSMANYWSEKGWSIDLITISDSPSFYPLNPLVRRHQLGLMKTSGSSISGVVHNVKRIAAIRRTINRLHPGIVISFMTRTNIIAVIALMGTGIPLLVSERIFPQQGEESRIWSFFRTFFYPFASSVIVQTNRTAQYYRSKGVKRISIIPNPVYRLPKKQNYGVKRKRELLAVGRLVDQKGFDLLISAFARCDDSWKMVIVGQGPEKKRLAKLAEKEGISGRVCFSGVTSNIESYYNSASIFVLSSRYEGFPNVLLEAMANGVPSIAFDCPAGPADIIEHLENGMLVPNGDVQALYKNLTLLMENDDLREKLGKNGQKVAEKFSVETIMDQWEYIIKETGSRGN